MSHLVGVCNCVCLHENLKRQKQYATSRVLSYRMANEDRMASSPSVEFLVLYRTARWSMPGRNVLEY